MDSRGNKVFLTGLMFGRHHRLFGLARHIQVRPISPGAAEIIVVPRQRLSPEEAAAAFDDTNVHVTFSFRISDAPQRTSTGKLPLLVPCSR
jgi:phenylacetate-CoA ligase